MVDVEQLEIDAPGRGEVAVDVAAAGLCHTDLHYMQGKFRAPVPLVPGHESAGVVTAVGEDVTYVQPGDHVVCCGSIFCGSCNECLSGRPFLCRSQKRTWRPSDAVPRLRSHDGSRVHQFMNLGGFAEQMLVHEHAVVKVDPGMPKEVASILGCGVLTGTGAVFRTAAVPRGATVCVIGAGATGLAAIQAARIAGARQIVAVDIAPPRLALAERLGATDVIDAGATEDVVEAVRKLTNGGVDHSFEVVGSVRTAEQAFQMLALGGMATIVGMIPDGDNIPIRGLDLIRGQKRLQGSLMGSNQFRIDIPALVDLYLRGDLLLDEMVTATIALDGIPAGYEALEHGHGTRTVIRF